MIDANAVTIALLAIVALSLLHGMRAGASASARQLVFFFIQAAVMVGTVALAASAATAFSPRVQQWLHREDLVRPAPDAASFKQLTYTIIAGIRDLPLLRFAALFLVSYVLIRLLVAWLGRALAAALSWPLAVVPSGGAIGRIVGGAIGSALGAARALLFTSVLFAYCALFPHGTIAGYIEQSGMYREVAAQVIRPAIGPLLESRLPIFANTMSAELSELWLRRYDVIDAHIPDDIVQAAAVITQDQPGDMAKARALYDWVGSRIAYDHDKVRAYEERGEWREQDPETTFRTRLGVCIDYARLYAAMARAVGLDARVITGQGYDGRGGYGAHAWNEVYSQDEDRWVPLDATWAQTGNWFDPPRFSDTHISQG